jgi:hypothetical protein
MADLQTEYRRIRREHPYVQAKNAFLWARGNIKPTELQWETFGNHFASAKTQRDGFDIRVIVDYDEYPTDPMVSETEDDTGIRNPAYQGPDDYRHSRFLSIESGETLRGLVPYYRKQGDAKNVAWERARQSLQDEAKAYLSDDYVRLVITVKVSKKGIELGSASIGTDLIIDYKTLERELDDAVSEAGLISEAIDEARKNLAELLTDTEGGLTN